MWRRSTWKAIKLKDKRGDLSHLTVITPSPAAVSDEFEGRRPRRHLLHHGLQNNLRIRLITNERTSKTTLPRKQLTVIDHRMSSPAAANDDDGGDGCGVVDVSSKSGSFAASFPGSYSSWVTVPTRRPPLPRKWCCHCGKTTVRHRHHLSRSRPTQRMRPNRAASGSAASAPSARQSFPASKESSRSALLLLTHCDRPNYSTHLCEPTTKLLLRRRRIRSYANLFFLQQRRRQHHQRWPRLSWRKKNPLPHAIIAGRRR